MSPIDINADFFLDVSNFKCPLPVLKTRKRLAKIASGQTLKIIATDPMAAIDFPHFCNESGNVLIASGEKNDKLVFIIEKS